MANIMDYLVWRGEFGLELSPWNEVDALMFAVLSYLDYEKADNEEGKTLAQVREEELLPVFMPQPAFPRRKKLCEAMAGSLRFRNVKVHHFISITEKEAEIQFCAMCFDLPDGTLCVSFRGTDSTIVGWREDLNMSLMDPVPSQEAARFYLQRVAEITNRPLRLVGHSKGGNMAAFAAACATADVQDRIIDIYSFDGPGMSPEIFRSDGYQRIVGKIRSFVPQTSVIGMMMEYHRAYHVVRSDASGIQQHEPLTWQVYGKHFEELPHIDETAKTISTTLHEWLDRSNPEEREAFVDTVFQMLESTKASTVGEIVGDKFRSLRSVLESTREIDPEMRKASTKLVSLFISLGLGNVVDLVRGRRGEAKEGKESPDENEPGENGQTGTGLKD